MTCARCGMPLPTMTSLFRPEPLPTKSVLYLQGWIKTRDGWTCPDCVKPRRKR